MTKLYKKLATITALAAMMTVNVTPAMAGSYNFTISGNGSDSDSKIDLDNDRTTEVFQTNTTEIVNDISVSSNTGGNDVNDNTGGDVEVDTGDVEIAAQITNQAGSNHAEVEACDCDSDIDVKVDGNGTNSDNDVKIDNDQETSLVQDNLTNILNALDFEGNSGDNDVKDNTGGSTSLDTGDVTIAPVEIINVAGVNEAVIGSGSHSGSELDLAISGNGSESDNDIDVDNSNKVGFFQTNAASVLNELYFGGFTGENEMKDNTGEAMTDPALDTGDVTIKAGILNMTGFNVASGDCGCVLDVEGKIAENGTDSDNDIELDLEDESVVTQDNIDALLNTGDVESDTGDNDVNDNTAGEVNVETGSTLTQIVAENVGGTNAFGPIGLDIQFPWGTFSL